MGGIVTRFVSDESLVLNAEESELDVLSPSR